MPRRAFQQELPRELERAARTHASARVELWAEDEHRIGLKLILRMVWAKRGRRPAAVIRPRYRWLYVVAFVHTQTGQSVWWRVSKLDEEIAALQRARVAPPVAEAPPVGPPAAGMPARQVSAVPEPGTSATSGPPGAVHVTGEAGADNTGLDSLLGDLRDLEPRRDFPARSNLDPGYMPHVS